MFRVVITSGIWIHNEITCEVPAWTREISYTPIVADIVLSGFNDVRISLKTMLLNAMYCLRYFRFTLTAIKYSISTIVHIAYLTFMHGFRKNNPLLHRSIVVNTSGQCYFAENSSPHLKDVCSIWPGRGSPAEKKESYRRDNKKMPYVE